MHIHEEPMDPRPLNPRISDGLAAVILKCMAKDPAARPQSFVDLSESLISLYMEIAGKDYGRKNPGELESRAADLNNRALSMLDLGKRDEANRLLGALSGPTRIIWKRHITKPSCFGTRRS